MKSSYLKNNYGDVFFTLIEAFRPMKCVELGVLNGYSSIAIGNGLKHNHKHKRNGEQPGHLDAYDLWNDYPFQHSDMNVVQRTLETEEVSNYVTLFKGDAFECWKAYENRSIQFLHIDISNTGEILRKIIKLWDHKMQCGGIIVFEGGSKERDEFDWMTKYDKEKIRPELFSNKIINSNYVYGIYHKFPSLTVLLKKWENVWVDPMGIPHTD